MCKFIPYCKPSSTAGQSTHPAHPGLDVRCGGGEQEGATPHPWGSGCQGVCGASGCHHGSWKICCKIKVSLWDGHIHILLRYICCLIHVFGNIIWCSMYFAVLYSDYIKFLCVQPFYRTFAMNMCDRLIHMIGGLATPVDVKLQLIQVFQHMHHDAETAATVS